MTARKTSPPPGFLISEEASAKLGITKDRLYQYVKLDRIDYYTFGRAYMFLVEDVEQFKRNPTGRARSKRLSWRMYRAGAKVLLTEIDVQVRTGQQQKLVEMLQTIGEADEHAFPGTIARYILQEDKQKDHVQILLFWKSTDIPNEEKRQNHLAVFQSELEDVLDWGTAQIKTKEALIHT